MANDASSLAPRLRHWTCSRVRTLRSYDAASEVRSRDGGTRKIGEREIRTRGQLPVAGFQDRCLKPLGQLSSLQCKRLDVKRKQALESEPIDPRL